MTRPAKISKPAPQATSRETKARPAGRFALQLDLNAQPEASELPAFLRIARAVANDARSGRLAKGARLPGSRELAGTLGVHRNTVLAAYRELLTEGFLQTAQGRGTFIAHSLPDVKPRRWQPKARASDKSDAAATDRSRIGFAFDPPRTESPFKPVPKGTLALFGGVPDTRLVPREAFGRALRRAVQARVDYLGYGDPQGEECLRSGLAEMLRTTRGLAVTADDVLITRGSQMALALVARLLLGPNDVIAVEALGYPPAWRAFGAHGAKLRPVPVDAQGLSVSALAKLCESEPVRAVYVTPHHQYPTTVTMSAGRRMALLQLARERKFAIIEDDYDHESHYDGRPVLPIASADDAGVVLYIGSLSKVLAPGLRIGYLVAPTAVREAARTERHFLDRQGDRLTERALADLLEDGELQRHVWRVRRTYKARRDHAVEVLRDALGDWLDVEPPSGGMALWAHVRELDVMRWAAEAEKRGVLFQPGQLFTWGNKPTPHARIGYGGLTESEMTEAAGRLRKAALAARRDG